MIRLLGDRVLVVLPPRELESEATVGYTYQPTETTASGLIVAKPAEAYDVRVQTRGLVVQLGEKTRHVALEAVLSVLKDYEQADVCRYDDIGRAMQRLGHVPSDVQVGECVIFSPSVGEPVSFDGLDYLILHEDDVLGIVQPMGEERAWLERIGTRVQETLTQWSKRDAA